MAAASNEAKKPRMASQSSANYGNDGGQAGGTGRKSNQPVTKGHKAN
jgi:hypothetical protein